MEKVRGYVLISGMTIITQEEDEDGNEVYWIEPMNIIPINVQAGKLGLAFTPLVLLSDNSKVGPVNLSSILFEFDLSEAIENAYHERLMELRAGRSGLVVSGSMPNNVVDFKKQ